MPTVYKIAGIYLSATHIFVFRKNRMRFCVEFAFIVLTHQFVPRFYRANLRTRVFCTARL